MPISSSTHTSTASLPAFSLVTAARPEGAPMDGSEVLARAELVSSLRDEYGEQVRAMLSERPQLMPHLTFLETRIFNSVADELQSAHPPLDVSQRLTETVVEVRNTYSVDQDTAAQDLIKRFGTFIRSMASARLNDFHQVEDVSQEILLRLLSSLPRYNPERGALITWVRTIAGRYVTDVLRRERVRSGVQAHAEVDEATSASDSIGSIEQREQLRNLVARIGQLPEKERDVLKLVYLRGYTLRQAASALGIELGTCKSRLSHGLAHLRELVDAGDVTAPLAEREAGHAGRTAGRVALNNNSARSLHGITVEYHAGTPFLLIQLASTGRRIAATGTDPREIITQLYQRGMITRAGLRAAFDESAQSLKGTHKCAAERSAALLLSSLEGCCKDRDARYLAQYGTPYGLVIQDARGEVLRLLPPAPPQRLVHLQLDCRYALETIERNYRGSGREKEIELTRNEVQSALRVLEVVFEWRRRGYGNQEAAERVAEECGQVLSSDRISQWVAGHTLPEPIALVLSNSSRRQSTFKAPLRASIDLSYLLGVQVATTHFASSYSDFGLSHEDMQVMNRCRQALSRLGLEPTFRKADDPFSGEKHTLRVRSLDLCGLLFEQTDGFTRLPWAYLVGMREKVAFLGGMTDAGGVVLKDRLRFVKEGAGNIFEELALLLVDVGVLSTVQRGPRASLSIASGSELRSFRALIGPRYGSFDRKLNAACIDGGKYHPSLREYRAYERAVTAVGRSLSDVSEYLRVQEKVALDREVLRRWLNGVQPLAARRLARIEALRAHYPDITECHSLAHAGVPRNRIFSIVLGRGGS